MEPWSGKTLAHYEIRSPLGQGGMGEVFVAHDRKLSRDVAFKVLPSELAANPERLARFEREAKAIAALNHPNIVHVYSVEAVDGIHFITMELVKGKTLAEAIPRGGFEVGRFFAIAIELSEAVAAAHRQGVIHRDLKPSNVMLSDEGRVKVLDFGLAKPRELASDSRGSELDTSLKTAEGRVLGTMSYMAPEQAEGKSVDERADVFALGVVFYEMLTGKRPFGGDTPASILASVLKDTPRAPTEFRADVPPGVSRIVKRCLQKEPDRRFQTALDVRNELEEMRGELAAHPVRARGGGAWKSLSSAAVTAAVAFGIGYALRPASSRGGIRFTHPRQLTSAAGVEAFPSWSPDGSRIAYSASATAQGPAQNSDIWVVQASGGPPVNLTADHEGFDARPSWSPDGSQIAFASDREGPGCYVMPALGGPARKIVSSTLPFAAAQWGPDGTTLACASLQRVRVSSLHSGEFHDLELPGTKDVGLWAMSWSPDGRFFAYVTAILPESPLSMLWIADAATGEGYSLTDGNTNVWGPSFGPDGALYYVSNAAGAMDLWRQPLNTGGKPEGDPETLTVGIGMHQRAAFSPDGTRLAFSKGGFAAQLWRAPVLEDREATWNDAEQLTFDQSFLMYVDVTRDGKNVAFSSDRSGNLDVWLLPSTGGEPRQLTTDPTPDWSPNWSPDGTEVAIYAFRGGSRDIWVVPVGEGPSRQLTRDETSELNPRWSPDGSEILYAMSLPAGEGLFTVASRGDALPRALSLRGYLPDWSPEGRWISYATGTNGELWLAKPDGSEPRKLVDSIGLTARFAPNGEQLYFADRELANLWSVSVESGTRRRLTRFEGRRGQLGSLALATDGKYLYFTWHQDLGDLWVMDVVESS
jgi:Tol biopolymer transport system component/serine/threonine protein kinase